METMLCKEVEKEVGHFYVDITVFEECDKSEGVHVVFEASSAFFSKFPAEFFHDLGVDESLEAGGQI